MSKVISESDDLAPIGSQLGARRQFYTAKFRAVGAVGLEAQPTLIAADILIASEPGHPEQEAATESRYSWDYKDKDGVLVNVRDFESIKTVGLIQTPLVTAIQIGDKLTPIAVEGSRRVWLWRQIDAERATRGEAPIPIPVNFKEGMSLGEIDIAHASGNEGKSEDNWISRARKMQILRRGRPECDPPVPPHTLGEIGKIFNLQADSVGKILDKKRGLLTLSPKCQAALENHKILQSTALQIAKVSDHNTQDALLDKAMSTVAVISTVADGEPAPAPNREQTKALVQDTIKNGGTADAVANAKTTRDQHVTPGQIKNLKARLKALDPAQDQSPIAIALGLIDYLVSPSEECLEGFPADLQALIMDTIRIKG